MEINLKTSLLAVVIFTGLLSEASAASSEREVASSAYWLRLLHYTSSAIGPARSEIASPEFFLSPNGSTDPLAELNASVAAFQLPASATHGVYEQHPQCAYPERFRFLSERLGLQIAAVRCAEFEKFKSSLRASAVSIVYAAPYMGNPSSMFGHTFLRFNSDQAELTNPSVSYDALPERDKGFQYAWRGLTGGYRGVFSVQPYYAKVKSYSQLENRDLWEFQLALSSAQVEVLAAHLWELGSSYFKYYFIDENCSYQLLSLLEVAQPDWQLLSKFRIATVPLDTVRALDSYSGAVVHVSQRRSQFAVFSAKLASLNSADQKAFEEIRRDMTRFSGSEPVAVLEALIEWNRYQVENQIDGGHPLPDALANAVLLARSKSPAALEQNGLPPESPLGGHRSSKISFGGADENGVRAFGFRLRPVLHDILDADLGYAAYSSLIVGQTDIAYFPAERKFALEQLTVAEVVNLQPMTLLRRRTSWLAALKLGRPSDRRCLDCFGADLSLGGGAGTTLISERLLVSALLKADIEASNHFQATTDHLVRYAPTAELLVLLNLNDRLKVRATADFGWYISSFDREAPPFSRYAFEIARPLRKLQCDVRLEFALLEDRQEVRHETRQFSRITWGFYF